jgi:hypothetical protein
METEIFTFRKAGSAGCEIVGPDGVVAWTVDSVWAARIVALLNGADDVNPTSAYTAPAQT